MADRPRHVIEQELAEARGDLSRLQGRGEGSSVNARAALKRVVALQEELDKLDEDGGHEKASGDNG